MKTSPLMSGLHRCKLFEDIAEDVWKRVNMAHDVGINLNECGLTKDILVDILHYNKLGVPNFDVYARPSYDEPTYGSDMDVFIEVRDGQYIWIALQAKLLKKNKRYDTLRDTSDGTMQWDKLTRLEAVTGCKSYYLMYNGHATFQHTGNDACSRPFIESQFGCSLVEPQDIKKVASLKDTRGRNINPLFKTIHPKLAQPWRVLVCCFHNLDELTLYSTGEILGSNADRVLVKSEILSDDISIEDDSSAGNQANSPDFSEGTDDRILNGSREANWNPDLRIVIKTTTSLRL